MECAPCGIVDKGMIPDSSMVVNHQVHTTEISRKINKDGRQEEDFDACEWPAAMTSHVLTRAGWLQWFRSNAIILKFPQILKVAISKPYLQYSPR